jgi:hypothetical protein
LPGAGEGDQKTAGVEEKEYSEMRLFLEQDVIEDAPGGEY